LRVFLAIDIPDEVRRAIGELIEKLRATCRGARWARVEGMHITLKFIGEAFPEKVERIKSEMRPIQLPAPVELNFRDVGFFPNARSPRVFWAGVETTPNLAELVQEIERRLEPLGIGRELRPFRPHLTLARFRSQDGLAQLREALAKLAPFEFGAARAGEFHLYQSHLKREGAEYTKLESFPFALHSTVQGFAQDAE
jgi:2'-5' RNA ligase